MKEGHVSRAGLRRYFGSNPFLLLALGLVAMLGSQGIMTQTPLSQIVPWTRVSLEKLFEKGLDGDPEAAHVITAMVHGSLEEPIISILEYMGEEDTNLTGGTMGAPHTPSDIAEILMRLLESYLLHVFRAHFEPKWAYVE